jgi:hypothetical protein
MHPKNDMAKASRLIDIKVTPIINRKKSLEGMVAMAARAIWKGSISFGLVNIPFRFFPLHKTEVVN